MRIFSFHPWGTGRKAPGVGENVRMLISYLTGTFDVDLFSGVIGRNYFYIAPAFEYIPELSNGTFHKCPLVSILILLNSLIFSTRIFSDN